MGYRGYATGSSHSGSMMMLWDLVLLTLLLLLQLVLCARAHGLVLVRLALVDLLLVGVGGLGEDLLLPRETGLDLGHGLLLHLGLRPSTGNGLDGRARASAGEGHGDAGNASGNADGAALWQRLRWPERHEHAGAADAHKPAQHKPAPLMLGTIIASPAGDIRAFETYKGK